MGLGDNTLAPAHRAHLVRAIFAHARCDETAPSLNAFARVLRATMLASGACESAAVVVTICFLGLLVASTESDASTLTRDAYNAMRVPFAVFYTFEWLMRFIMRGPLTTPRRGRPFLFDLLEAVPDVAIVAAGWLELMPSDRHPFASRLTAVRALRLIYPLSQLDVLALKPTLHTLAISASDISSVMGVLALFQFLFAVVATQFWHGVMQGECGYVDASSGKTVLAMASPAWFVNSQPCAFACDAATQNCAPATGSTCPALVAPFANGTAALVTQTCVGGNNPDWGQTHFDDIWSAMLNAFVISTQQGWSATLYAVWSRKGGSKAGVFAFFAVYVGLTGFLLTPLFLSTLTANFSRAFSWIENHEERLINAVLSRLRGVRKSVAALDEDGSSAKSEAGTTARIKWIVTDAAAADAAPDALFPDSPGPFMRRRRLDSIVSLFAAEVALTQIEADAACSAAASGCERPAWAGKLPPYIPGELWVVRGVRVILHAARSAVTSAASALRSAMRALVPARVAATHSALTQPAFASSTEAWASWTKVLLFGNIIVWALSDDDNSDERARALFVADAAFAAMSFANALLQFVSHVGVDYFSDALRVFDGACCAAGVLEVMLSNADGRYVGGSAQGSAHTTQLGNFVDALHTFRVLRVVMLMRTWFAGRRLLRRLVLAGRKAFGALALFVLYLLGFAIWGRQLLGPLYTASSTVFPNYSSFSVGVLATFQVADGGNWDLLLKQHMTTLGWPSVFFFLAMYVIGAFIAINLFVSTLVESSVVAHSSAEEKSLGYEATPARWQPLVRLAPVLDALSSFFFAPALDVPVYSDRKSTILVRTGAHGGATSVTVTLHSKVVDDDFSVKVTASGVTTVHAGDAHASRELTERKFIKWLYGFFAACTVGGRASKVASTEASAVASVPTAPTPTLPSDPSPALSCVARVRGLAHALSTSPGWLALSVLFIAWSSVNLGLEVPRLDFCDDAVALALRGASRPAACDYRDYFKASNAVIAAFFTLEFAVNAVARGSSLFTAPQGGLDYWTVLDVLVVLGAIGGLANARASWLLAFRAGRSLRVLRFLQRFSSLRVTASSLLRSMLRSAEPVALAFLLVTATAFAGMRLFGDAAQFCSSDMLPFSSAVVQATKERAMCGATPTRVFGDKCVLLPTVAAELACRANTTGSLVTPIWLPYIENFDNFGSALLTSFELLAGQNWPVYAQAYMSAMDSNPGTTLPSSSGAIGTAVFFIVTALLLQHFSVGLFGGFVARTYFADRALTLGLGSLSVSQRVWIENLRAALSVRAPRTPRAPPSPFAFIDAPRAALLKFVLHPVTENCITAVVAVNMLIIAAPSVSSSRATIAALDMASNIFSVFFLVELIARVAAFGVIQFASRSYWELLDAAATLISCAALVSSNSESDPVRVLYVVARLARVLRVFRLAFKVPGVRRTLLIIGEALPSVVNILAVHALLIYMFSSAFTPRAPYTACRIVHLRAV